MPAVPTSTSAPSTTCSGAPSGEDQSTFFPYGIVYVARGRGDPPAPPRRAIRCHGGSAYWGRELPYPRDYRQDSIWVPAVPGFEFGREPFPTLDDERCPPQSPEKRERCPQDMFDPILTRFARRFPHVSIRYGAELI